MDSLERVEGNRTLVVAEASASAIELSPGFPPLIGQAAAAAFKTAAQPRIS